MSRDDLATEYFAQLPFEPYPVQEEALLAWFTADQGVLVCAPTGTGKTLIAEAALFEALHTGHIAYYTTPLIALTEQKFRELQQRAIDWGFAATDVGLVTGNRRENADAKILVVVAEILLNRLLHHDAFDFTQVAAVVMDEFHSFNDPERGAVWELTLALLPPHVRTLLLSATVGNARAFNHWLERSHGRRLKLVESSDRRVPLTFAWVGDQLLNEQLLQMAEGDEIARYTPALVFCFNREECWNVAEQLKGKQLIDEAHQSELKDDLEQYDWSQGAGPKLRQLLMRGVGVHHAGILPKYRRIVEDLFQRKLLSVALCTETLAAGVNLPARSVVLPTLLKGPPDKKRLIEASSAHQIFGRAGRPQFDTQGYVFAMAAEDDVKIARWKEKYDQIPEDTKDLGLRKAKKALKKKMPKRRTNMQYWHESQFERLRDAPAGDLASKGDLPWRLLAHLLAASPEVQPLRALVSKRLLDTRQMEAAQKRLDRMLMILWRAGYVTLDPPPSIAPPPTTTPETVPQDPTLPNTLFGLTLGTAGPPTVADDDKKQNAAEDEASAVPRYRAERATPTELLPRLSVFRSINPLFGVFLINHLGIASRAERLQAMESTLELPGSVARNVRIPRPPFLAPGPLETTRLNEQLLRLGLVTADELQPSDEEKRVYDPDHPPPPPLNLPRKLQMLFDYDFPDVEGLRIQPVWVAGELLEFNGEFNKFVTSRKLQKQEGVIFRHLLRMILLLEEFAQICPPELSEQEWKDELREIKARLTESCLAVDALSTQKTLELAAQAEVLE